MLADFHSIILCSRRVCCCSKGFLRAVYSRMHLVKVCGEDPFRRSEVSLLRCRSFWNVLLVTKRIAETSAFGQL